MAKTLQIIYGISFVFILSGFFSAQEKWSYSAEEMEQKKINGELVRRLNNNVRFFKTNQIILTDKALQYIDQDILFLNGNTIMINGLDTLTCDSMIYWSTLDSGYAMGDVHYIESHSDRHLYTQHFNYWETKGFRGSSFITEGYTKVIEPNYIIIADKMIYDDKIQVMQLLSNASIESRTQGIFGDEMVIHYIDSLIKKINITSNANAYNDIQVKINNKGPYRNFRDKMSSKNMIAHFKNKKINKLYLSSMAKTLFYVINDSLLIGNNESSGDSINIDFKQGDIKRIQVFGGALGEFEPESNNSKIDTTILYGAEYIDYHINDEKTYLSTKAYVEYQNTKLGSGKIIVDWETNFLDALPKNNEYPTIQNFNEEPMTGNSMVFDLTTKHGRIDKGRTSYNNSYYHGKEVFRDDPNIFHVKKSKYTSCELENPHFYLASRKMKMLPGYRVIARPIWLYIYDIPIIGFPLAVFPHSKNNKRQSGWIMPSFDSYNRIGTGFRNFGYYWAPNEYLDAMTTMNFFDKEGYYVYSNFEYNIRHGQRKYNYNIQGKFNGTFKRSITSNEILDLFDDKESTENFIRLNWIHSQAFDPTQRLSFNYKYISNKTAYQNNQEVDLQNRLNQNLISSITYKKNWATSSFSIGYNEERNLSVENNPSIGENGYKYKKGPKATYKLNTRKAFGQGDNWFNKIFYDYRLHFNNGKKDYYIIKDEMGNISFTDKKKKFSLYHKSNIDMPTNILKWITINPHINFTEYWIWTYKEENSELQLIEKEGFKRRLTWNSSISAKTDLYGMIPLKIGRLDAIRHVITPSVSYNYAPDFSDSKFENFQKNSFSGNPIDYFQDYSATPIGEKKYYMFSLNNIFQAKVYNKKGEYTKGNFLTLYSNLKYNPAKKNGPKLDELESKINIKNLSGKKILGVSMKHNLYRLHDGNVIDILKGELPRLTYIQLSTNLRFNLSGSNIIHDESIKSKDDLPINNSYSIKKEEQLKMNSNNKIWETQFEFRYGTSWAYPKEKWDYSLSLYATHKINLSKNWSLVYMTDFNLKEKEIIRNRLSIKRPIHCWEFSFSYWPGNSYSSGFSLQINVRNPDLRDIKITSKDSNRGFGSF